MHERIERSDEDRQLEAALRKLLIIYTEEEAKGPATDAFALLPRLARTTRATMAVFEAMLAVAEKMGADPLLPQELRHRLLANHALPSLSQGIAPWLALAQHAIPKYDAARAREN